MYHVTYSGVGLGYYVRLMDEFSNVLYDTMYEIDIYMGQHTCNRPTVQMHKWQNFDVRP